jgi:biopolymer transport protein ExbB/TolQ
MDMNILQQLKDAGIVVQLITAFMLVLSIWTVYAVIERFVAFSKASRQTYSYVLALRDYLEKRKVDEALTASKRHNKSPVAKVVEAGLLAYKQGLQARETHGAGEVGDFDIVDSVNRALERVKERETSALRKNLGGLATIASITPFIGLLGTVVGIIGAFEKIKGGGGMDVIGPSIAEALIETALGLVIAIPAAMAFNYFTGKVETMVVDMSDVSSEFIDYVLREGRA